MAFSVLGRQAQPPDGNALHYLRPEFLVFIE
jgi:hypothetical protein